MSGEVPERWSRRTLGSIMEFVNGYPFKPEDWQEAGTPIIRIQNLNGSQEFNYFNGSVPARHHVHAGDLLFCWSGSRGTSFGPRIWSGSVGFLNQHIFRCVVGEGVDPDYAYFLLRGMTASIEREAHGGGGLVHIKKSELVRFEANIPPLDEQRRIAEVLRSVDEAIAASKAVERAVGVVFRRRRQELIEQARRGSSEVAVAAALRKNRGEKLTKLQTEQYDVIGRYPIVDQGARFVCGYTDDEGALWPYDLPVVVFGDHTRILKFVDFPFAIGADGTQCLTPAVGIRPRYLYYALQSLDLRAEGYARHFKLLKEKTIPIPTRDEQVAIEDELFSIETTESEARQSIQKLEAVKSALSSDLLSGRIRVPA